MRIGATIQEVTVKYVDMNAHYWNTKSDLDHTYDDDLFEDDMDTLRDYYSSIKYLAKHGGHGYTQDWAIWVDVDGDWWINGEYTVESRPIGTADTLVVANGDGTVTVKYPRGSTFQVSKNGWTSPIRITKRGYLL